MILHDRSSESSDEPPPDGPAGARAMVLCDSPDVWPADRTWPRCSELLFPLHRRARVGGTVFDGVVDLVPVTDPDGNEARGVIVRIVRAEAERGPLEFTPADVAEARRLLRMVA